MKNGRKMKSKKQRFVVINRYDSAYAGRNILNTGLVNTVNSGITPSLINGKRQTK